MVAMAKGRLPPEWSCLVSLGRIWKPFRVVSTKLKLMSLLAALAIAVLCGLLLLRWLPKGGDSGGWVRPNALETESPADPKTAERLVRIEAERKKWSTNYWAPELEAQRHEEVFVRFWDSLRRAEDPFAILGSFSFEGLELGELRMSPTADEHGITIGEFFGPRCLFSHAQWLQLLASFMEQGYQLDHSEWRQASFTEAQWNQPAQSVFQVVLHVIQREKQQRWVVRGELHVRWEEKSKENLEPVPALIRAEKVTVLHRVGRPIFRRVLSRQVEPEQGGLFIDPLILHDLDLDGLPEIILASKNLVYRNQGSGQFQTRRLSAQLTNLVHTALLADFDRDGNPDLLVAGSMGLALVPGDPGGQFDRPMRIIKFTEVPLANPFTMTCGDMDGDGDLDVWLTQYKLPYVVGQMPTPFYDANDGFPAFLLENDGKGGFKDITNHSGLERKRFRRTYSATFVDLDEDHDLDLVVASDFAGIDLYLNDGRGRFTDATQDCLPESHGFSTGLVFADFNGDSALDFAALGRRSWTAQRLDALKLGPSQGTDPAGIRSKMGYGNRLVVRQGNRFVAPAMAGVVAEAGWSWGGTALDYDNDGDLDLYVGTGYKSRNSARDYDQHFWLNDIYVASSRHDAALDVYFRSTAGRLYASGISYGGHFQNRFFVNQTGTNFLEAGFLVGGALELDSRNVVAADLDADGRLDLIVSTIEEWPQYRHGIHIFQNRGRVSGNWIGVHLEYDPAGKHSPIGARVVLVTPNRRQTRSVVTGDSFRSQHALSAHFGLGTESKVERMEIIYPGGQREALQSPGINQYHRLRSRSKP